METIYSYLFIICLVIVSLCVFATLVRLIKGPKPADRIVAVNMIGTMVIVMIGLVACILGESYLLDVALIYAAVSFLSVVVFTRIYVGRYRKNEDTEKKEDN